MRYEFSRDDAFNFAKHIGANCFTRGNELIFQVCPFCNRAEKDNKNKFSISLNTGQYQCKRSSCGAKGNMLSLAQEFGFSLGRDIDVYHHIGKQPNYLKARPVPEYVPSDPVEAYMFKRGISAETTARYRLKCDEDKPNVMAIPFINADGLIENVKYRKMDFDKTKDKNKEWFLAGCKPILFGMAQCKNRDRLVITEGQMDAIALAEAGIDNPVSVPNGANGFTWIPHCWNWVCEFKEIVVFGDRENGTITLVDIIAQRFSGKKVYRIRDIDYRDKKDANDILISFGKEALVEAVNNATLMASGRIKQMADVESKSIEAMESIKTGFDTLDETMCGGFQLGTFNVLTGKRGDGKSTFASQLMANAIRQKYKTFIYSGELNDYMVKNWLVQQISGFHNAPKDIKEKIDAYLKDMAYLYDNTAITDELNDVIEVLREAAQKYECKFLIVDNLMTAIDTGSSDIYGAQADFCKKLSDLAMTLNVVILLIAHPRKGGAEDINDSISGSSNITDRASYVLSYDRIKDCPDDNIRRVSISKNRLTGRLLLKRGKTDERMECVYDQKNKRITEKDKAQIDYDWEHDFVLIDEMSEMDVPDVIPF